MTNPLQSFFRQPAIYLRLPSDGSFWPENSLEIPQNREFPVYPMTAIDEISYRTPDALFNGQAVVDVIQSCIPNIKNAWFTPSIDFNSLLIAIRIASYGHDMPIESICPKCENSSSYEIDLRHLLDKVGKPNYDETVKHGNLEFLFRPMTFENQNVSSIAQFEQQKMISGINESDLPEEEKVKQMSGVMKRITELTVRALSYSIIGIRADNNLVTDTKHIAEFLERCDRKVFGIIRDHAVKLRQQSEIQPLTMTCDSCQYEYFQTVDLDMSNFFVGAS